MGEYSDADSVYQEPAILDLATNWSEVKKARRIVIKIGSNLLTGGGATLDREWIGARCQEISHILHSGRQVVVVTSGAVAAGAPRLGLTGKPKNLVEKQAAAAAGQGVLMGCYEEAFHRHGRYVAQILLTRDDVSHRRRYLNARGTLETLLGLGLVPIVNENDTVMVEELKFGDNDTLAALVAGLIGADLLILLTDVDGLYPVDPRQNPDVRLIPLVAQVTPDIEAMAGGIGSQVGSGGMMTKLAAARMAARYGCRTVLAPGRSFKTPLHRILLSQGEQLGTLFLAEATDPIRHRKRWIANALSSKGFLDLDFGAVTALRRGKSLLAPGIIAVEGQFDRGDAVYCRAPDGECIAKGLVHYAAEHLKQIIGCQSSAFETILGFMGEEEIIHREDMVLLTQTVKPLSV
ncbi:MAG: glutamate 5-kinase [Magnetococcus sp. DMHC-6]